MDKIDLENFPTRKMARDMMSMISPIYDKSYVGKWIFEVMSEPLELARKTVDDLHKEAFPETATWSLPYWEEAYSLETNQAQSQEERRKALTKKRNYRRPMNPYRIAQIVTETCGRPSILVENVAPHTFEICISPGTSEANIQKIIDTVYDVKQSQKSFRVVFQTPVGVQIRAAPQRTVYGYRMAGEMKKAGQWPQPNIVGKLENLQTKVDIDGSGNSFPYILAGTKPDINTPGALEAPGLNASIAGESTGIAYKICGAKRL